MSRTKHGSKGPGYDFWSRRPPNSGVQCHGKFAKQVTHRMERRQNSRIVRKAMETVTAFLLLPILAFAAPPRIAVAIAEAEAFSQYDQRRELPNDFANGASGQQSTDGASEGNAQQPKLDLGRSLVIEERDRLKAEVEDLEREMNITKDNLKAQADRVRVLSNPREDVAVIPSGDASRGLMPRLELISPVASVTPGLIKFRAVLNGPDWCGYCNANDATIRQELALFPGIKYTHHHARDESSFQPEVRQYARKYDKWPVWQIECADGKWYMINGVHTLHEIIEFHQTGQISGKPRVANTPVAASGYMGMLNGMGTRVREARDFWSTHVNGKVTVIWDSNRNNGTGSGDGFAILNAKARDWTEERVYGTFGQFSILCPGGIRIGDQLFEELTITYKTVGDKVQIVTSFAVEKSALFPGPKSFGDVKPSSVVDPGAALFIFNFLCAAWEIAHPELDIQLPGRIAADITVENDAFKCVFTGSPRIRAKAYWEWMLGVKQAIVSDTNAHLDFLPQPGYWFQIHSRDVSLN